MRHFAAAKATSRFEHCRAPARRPWWRKPVPKADATDLDGTRLAPCDKLGANLEILAAPPDDRRHFEHIGHRRCDYNIGLLEHLDAHPLLSSSALQKAAVNLQAVTGIAPQTLEALHRHNLEFTFPDEPHAWSEYNWVIERTQEALLQWGDITRGEDLFVSGLGGFDITAAVAKQSTLLQLFDDESEAGMYGYLYSLGWNGFVAELIRPASLQARGYFRCGEYPFSPRWEISIYSDDGTDIRPIEWSDPHSQIVVYDLASFLLQQPETNKPRQHFIRFARFWYNNPALLHELIPCAIAENNERWPTGGEAMRPTVLLRQIRDLERQRLAGPNIAFTHLDVIEDGCVHDNGLQLQILRSSHEVIRVARDLNNCAAYLVEAIARKRYVLIALVDTRSGRPVALGGWDLDMNFKMDEVVEKNNQAPSDETLDIYNAFLPVWLPDSDDDVWFDAEGKPEYWLWWIYHYRKEMALRAVLRLL